MPVQAQLCMVYTRLLTQVAAVQPMKPTKALPNNQMADGTGAAAFSEECVGTISVYFFTDIPHMGDVCKKFN